MDFGDVRPFLESNHRGVVTTFHQDGQKDGGLQSSIVVCGAYQSSAAFVSVRGILPKSAICAATLVVRCWESRPTGGATSWWRDRPA